MACAGRVLLGVPVSHWYRYFVFVRDPVRLLGGVLFLLTAARARPPR